MSASKVPSRRPPGRPSIPRVDGRAESAPALRPEAVGRRPVGLTSNATVAALEAEVARQKAARAAEADHLGEMLVRIASAENARSRAELASEALAERIGALEVELRVVRGQLDAERSAAPAAGPSLEEAEERARAAEARTLELGAKTTEAEAARDRAVRELEAMARKLEEARETREAMHRELETARAEANLFRAQRDDTLADQEAMLLSRGRSERELEGLAAALDDARRRLEAAERAAAERDVLLARTRALLAELDERDRKVGALRQRALDQAIAWLSSTTKATVDDVEGADDIALDVTDVDLEPLS